jgi:maltooligosyltrehalose trehalohydrolase
MGSFDMEIVAGRRCGAVGLPGGAVRWRVWAPRAKHVDLILLHGENRQSVPLEREPHGYFSHTQSDIPDGQRYFFRLDDGPERPDPASLWQPDGVHGPSAVVHTGRFSWSPVAWTGIARKDLVFYELHVGTFTPEGTFEAILPRLGELRELGVTALEIMPVAQFPGRRNWGYDGVSLYAVQNSYGGPWGLQKLVDACHAAGLAVFLDVVYNHLGPEGNYLNEFGPYFTDHYKTPWGRAVNYDGAGSDAVRDFVLDNARMWLEEFRLDGLRLDAVHAIYDQSPHHILRTIKEVAVYVAACTGRPRYVVAESDLNDVRLLRPLERGGYGLDAHWSDDFHHAVHTHLTGERQGYYADFGAIEDFVTLLRKTFIYSGRYSEHRGRRHGAPVGDLSGDRFVVCLQNHDQVGNRARGERLAHLVPPPARRLAASLLLFSPHLPLLFMGEEYGEEHPFLFFCSFEDADLVRAVREGRRNEFKAFAWQGEVPDPQAEGTFAASRLSWSWPDGTSRAGLRWLYQDLLAARRNWPALSDFSRRSVRLLGEPGQPAVLHLIRGGRAREPGFTLEAYFNLTDQRQPLPHPTDPREAFLFSSEARRYCGEREGASAAELFPYECTAFGPAAWPRPGHAPSLP